jgi:hypothetical protein
MSTIIISAINGAVLILGAGVCLPRALAGFIRACIPVIAAIAEFRAEVSAARSGGRKTRHLDDERRPGK